MSDEVTRTPEERALAPTKDLPEGPKTAGWIHTLICPGCDSEIDVTTGLYMVQPIGNGVLAWWHETCRDVVLEAIEQKKSA